MQRQLHRTRRIVSPPRSSRHQQDLMEHNRRQRCISPPRSSRHQLDLLLSKQTQTDSISQKGNKEDNLKEKNTTVGCWCFPKLKLLFKSKKRYK
ncbi:unnamed protein product [Brachionus calyciflorus]|uniref:Uncharacterized protein n=1 Tax=Brachionus calyciflorus TaxID=104777 RepID=A0A814IDE4_9BILA|nr:unnamed protein product [Brachionus calyciflorus]